MKILLLNGSPKTKNSSSEILLIDLKRCLSEASGRTDAGTSQPEIMEMALHTNTLSDEIINGLPNADVLVFSCPLYVDSIPGHLLSCLMQLEKYNREMGISKDHKIHIYGIVNCGFYEGIQAETALEILENWCAKTGFIWSGGIGVGGGGGLAMMNGPKPEKGPKAPIEKALRTMADKILRRETQENLYVSIAFPRFLYRMAAQMGWRQMIKANGGRARDL